MSVTALDSAKQVIATYYKDHKALYGGAIPSDDISEAHWPLIEKMRAALKPLGYANEEAVKDEIRKAFSQTWTMSQLEAEVSKVLNELNEQSKVAV